MTTPGAHPEPQPASPAREAARELSHEQLRHEVEALAEQVRGLGNGAATPSPPVPPPPRPPRTQPAPAAEPLAQDSDRPPRAQPAPAPPAEPLAQHSDRLLADVIAMAELAAAEIRASAERDAARMRARTRETLGEAEAALERHGQALAALGAETDRIEQAIAGLRAQARALEVERRRIDEALEAARRRR